MAGEASEPIERWTAKRRVVLVASLLKGEASVAEAARTHGLTVAEGKGGWLLFGAAPRQVFASGMGQAFAVAIVAFSVCFAVTALLSLATKPRPDEELRGLVYSLTPREAAADQGVPLYARPKVVAVVVLAATVVLNLLFW